MQKLNKSQAKDDPQYKEDTEELQLWTAPNCAKLTNAL